MRPPCATTTPSATPTWDSDARREKGTAALERFIFLTFDGLSRGAVYAAFALALVLIWRAARVVNFAQGAMAVATAYAGYSVASATGSYWLGFAVALVGGLLLGAAV